MKDLSCPFCNADEREVVASSPLAIVIRDGFPVSPGHSLIIPRRHVSKFSELTPQEASEIVELIGVTQNTMSPDGFNVGFNEGVAGGQTVQHFHIHVIPRYTGDVGNPRGGVRWVIPGKADY